MAHTKKKFPIAIAGVLIVAVFVIATVIVIMYARERDSMVQPAPTFAIPTPNPPVPPAATKPAKKSNRTSRDIPAILSPAWNALGQSPDPRVNELLNAHNTMLTNAGMVQFSGTCTWSGGKPRPLSVAYDVQAQGGSVNCGPNDCVIDGSKIDIGKETAMQVDALYLLLFRRFNPKDFSTSIDETIEQAGAKIECMRIDSTTEKIWFAKSTGKIARLSEKFPVGDVILDYITPWPSPLVPASVVVTVPVDWFGFKLDPADVPVITLDVDAASVDVLPVN